MCNETSNLRFLRGAPSASADAGGFTLIELMVAVAILAILSAIAVPAYSDYILRSHIASATSGLSAASAQMEQYFQDNRTYAAVGALSPPCLTPAFSSSSDFTITCNAIPSTPPAMTAAGMGPSSTATGYTIVAYGNTATVAGFMYSYSSTGGATWSITGTTWGSLSCNYWILKKASGC
jgi:type IV pilus assembly protein PilE